MRGMAPRRLFRLCVLCLCLCSASAEGRASQPLAVLPDAPIDVSTQWRYRLGDDPAWAAVDNDDSDWEPVDLMTAWGQPTAATSPGYAWYRLDLQLPAAVPDATASAPLGVSFGPVEYGGYEVFAGGSSIGRYGSSPDAPSPVPGSPQVFPIPTAAIRSDGRLVLAVRLWRNPQYVRVEISDRPTPTGPFALGHVDVLRERIELERLRTRFDTLPRVICSIVFALVGLYHIQLYRRRRQVREYLWFGLIAIGAATSIFFNTTWTDPLFTPLGSYAVALCAAHITAIVWFEFVYSIFDWSAGRWVRAFQFLQAGMLVLTMAAPRFTIVNVGPLNIVSLTPVLALWVFVIPREAWRGNRTARTITVGLLFLAASRFYQLLAIFALVPAYNFAHWGFSALLLSMAVSMSNRFSQVYSELDALNQDLEFKVEERTTELAATVAMLSVSEQEAVQAREVALEASRAKSTFLASMSHELRTPLNAILGFVQLMRHDAGITGERRENLGIIERSGEHLLSLINDILSISKIEAGQESLADASFSLRKLLASLDELFRLRAEAAGLRLEFSISDDIPPFVRGDESKIRQILINLLGNALKFTSEGTVSLAAEWNSDRASFEVSDTGRGIATNDLDRLFDPFTQTGNVTASREGTGLGLAISRRLARLMGGDITVSSELGRGSVFRVVIPLAQSTSSPAPAVRRVVRDVEPGQQRFRILVADDSATNRKLLKALMIAVGFDVEIAVDGLDVVRVWEEYNPHLIWMDVRMPNVDGLEATKAIRRLERQQNGDEGRAPTRIIALTASAFDSDRDELLAAGCNDFVLKPFKEEKLFAVMTEQLGVRFRYNDPEKPATSDRSRLSRNRQRVENIPASLVASLDRAVQHGDVETATEVIAAIGSHDRKLADELKSMLKGYRLDDIQEALGTSPAEHDRK